MKTIVIFDQAESAGGSIARAVDLANEMQDFQFVFITYRPLRDLYKFRVASNIVEKRVYSFYNYKKKYNHSKLLASKTSNKLLTYLGIKLISLADFINEYSVLLQALLNTYSKKIDFVQANAGVHRLPYRLASIKNAMLTYYFRHLDDYRWAEGKILERANSYIFVGSNLMEAHLALLKSVPREKCKVIYSPFDVDRRLKNESAENVDVPKKLRETGKKLIICNSRISAAKGQHIIIEAMQKLVSTWPELKLIFVGDADENKLDQRYLNNLKQKVQEYKLDDTVIFLGHRNNPLHILQYADIAIQAPTYFEALAGSLVESLQLGIPTVGAEIGGASEVLIDGKTGFLFPPGDHNTLADIIDRILRDPMVIAPIIERGKTYALQKWCPQKISAQMRAVYTDARGKK